MERFLFVEKKNRYQSLLLRYTSSENICLFLFLFSVFFFFFLFNLLFLRRSRTLYVKVSLIERARRWSIDSGSLLHLWNCNWRLQDWSESGFVKVSLNVYWTSIWKLEAPRMKNVINVSLIVLLRSVNQCGIRVRFFNEILSVSRMEHPRRGELIIFEKFASSSLLK